MTVPDTNNEELIDSILDEALSRIRSGRPFDLDEYCLRYPEMANELRVMLPAMTMLEKPLMDPVRHLGVGSSVSDSLPHNLADFQILSEIGRGAMGVVYDAIQRSLKRRVALKIMFQGSSSASDPMRFQREAEIAARLHHTNIIPVFEAGESDGMFYYAMQFIDGANLQQIIESQSDVDEVKLSMEADKSVSATDETSLKAGSTNDDQRNHRSGMALQKGRMSVELTPRTCAKIAIQVAEGLEFAHVRGILHRDIKPSNVILDRDPRAWIADFGLAKQEDSDDLTSSGDVLGTLRYLAPERFRGQADGRSDVYSLGMTLFEMLERNPAYRHVARPELVHQILNAPSPKLSHSIHPIPRDLEQIVAKSIARDPAHRYQRASDMAEDLQRHLDGRPILARQPSVAEHLLQWSKRNPFVACLLTTIAVLLFGGLAVVSTLLIQTRNQSRIADENFHAAMETVKTYLTKVSQSPELKSVGSEKLRRELLQSAKTYYEQFALRYVQNPTLKEELLDAHYQLGLINSELGRLAEAIEDFKTSLSILMQNPLSTPDKVIFAMRLLINIGDSQMQIGESSAAEVSLNESLRLGESLVDSSPNNLEYGLQLANVHTMLGRVLGSMKRAADEKASYDRAAELVQIATNRNASLGEYGERLVTVQQALGAARRKHGRLDESQHHYQQAISIGETMCQLEPESETHKSNLANALLKLGELEMHQRKLPESRAALVQAATILDKLVAQHPSMVAYADARATGQMILGNVEFADGRNQFGEEAWRRAQQMVSRLVEDYPDAVEFRFTLAKILANLGNVSYQLDRREDAVSFGRQSLEHLSNLVHAYPANTEYAGVHAGVSSNVAAFLQSSRKYQESLDILTDSLEAQKTLIAIQPDVRELRSALAGSYHAAIAYNKLQRTESAISHYEHAIEIYNKLLEDNTAAPVYAEGLAQTYDGLGGIFYNRGRFIEAEPIFQKLRQLAESAVALRPESGAARLKLGESFNDLATLMYDSSRADKSIEFFELASEQFRIALKQTEPKAQKWIGTLHHRRAKALCRLGRFEEALAECALARDPAAAQDENRIRALEAHISAASGSWQAAIGIANELEEVKFADPRETIELAAAWVLIAVAVADSDLMNKVLDAERERKKEENTLRSISLLNRAIDEGFQAAPIVNSISAFETLKDRDDFKEIMSKLEKVW